MMHMMQHLEIEGKLVVKMSDPDSDSSTKVMASIGCANCVHTGLNIL